MRIIGILFLALVTLALAPYSHAQSTAPGKPMSDQMERDVNPSSPSPPPSAPDLTLSLQTELKRVGCFEGAIDGVWDNKTKAALADFARRSKLDVPSETPTLAAVETLKSQRDRICPLDCGAGRIERNGRCVAKAAPENPPAKPRATGENKRPPPAKSDDDRPSSGMCWRNDGRTTALVPCNEAPTGRRAY